MAKPNSTAGTVGNLISGVTATHGAANAVAAFLDLSQSIEGKVTVETVTLGTAPSVVATWSAYAVYAGGPIALAAPAASGQSSVSLSSKAGLTAGQKVCLQQAVGSKLGEIATVSSITGSASPFTLTTTANLLNSYAATDGLYLIAQTPVATASPSSSAGTYANNADYSTQLVLGTGWYAVSVVNADTAQNITVNATYDLISSIS